ncbi:16S rRNA (guanine(966)-N(2))-methyltransferase RsmD [Leucobacter sp. NPDC077196]|uniref:16S rRNA (guanine(966)-N(2))-methyltransferase RsmD n=1 Tax=Leucobacter sp. NPDC077196 TaxID=3154959 RepID=UPI003441547B
MTRIISGAAGSLRLEVPKSGTRPTSDRVREAIFSTLTSWDLIEGVRVLDLYAGSGALGLESASRGAATVTLVEKHAQAAEIAKRNTRIVLGAFSRSSDEAPRIDVARQSVQAFLAAEGERSVTPTWDVVMIDPPYDHSEAEIADVLTAVVPLLAPGGAVLVERSTRSPEPSWPSGIERIREKRYGETALWWAEPAE